MRTGSASAGIKWLPTIQHPDLKGEQAGEIPPASSIRETGESRTGESRWCVTMDSATLLDTTVQTVMLISIQYRASRTCRWRQGSAHVIFSSIAPAHYQLKAGTKTHRPQSLTTINNRLKSVTGWNRMGMKNKDHQKLISVFHTPVPSYNVNDNKW